MPHLQRLAIPTLNTPSSNAMLWLEKAPSKGIVRHQAVAESMASVASELFLA